MCDGDALPGHGYVPGKTPRHEEDAFDHIRDTARDGMSIDQLATCRAFRLGLRYLETGYFWEAHELLEPVWMILPNASRERFFVQGIIQIANGFLKVKMERPKAALRLVAIARDLIPRDSPSAVMGVDLDWVHTLIETLEIQTKDAL